MNRRQFLIRTSQTVLGGIAISALPSWAHALAQPIPTSINDFTPIARITEAFGSISFNGDRVDRPHDILWDIEGFLRKKGGVPKASAHYDAVIIGGGVAGLTAAYQLRDKKVLIIDQDKRFGGNSKGENYNGTCYSIGAAYISKPDEGSALETVLSELGLLSEFRGEHGNEVSVIHKNQLAEKFWSGTTDPAAAAQFTKINSELIRIYESAYPEIPLTDETRDQVLQLDLMTFAEWLKKEFGAVHSDVEEYFSLYGWSSFGASINDLSAAQMINFVAAETQTIVALPGGNSLIAEKLMQASAQAGVKFEAGGLAIKLKIEDEKIQLCYLAEYGELISVSADTAIVAAPKFVASKIISDLPTEQATAMSRITYRAYVVANVLLNKEINSPAFDLYNLRGTKVIEPGPLKPGDRFVSDICFGDWANFDRGRSVLTLYMPLPYDGARQFLFKESSHESFKQKALVELRAVLPAFGVNESDIEGIRLTRWGHALPVARKGLLAEGHLERASASIQEKIFFANQDNFANPSFETAFATALEAARSARKNLA